MTKVKVSLHEKFQTEVYEVKSCGEKISPRGEQFEVEEKRRRKKKRVFLDTVARLRLPRCKNPRIRI